VAAGIICAAFLSIRLPAEPLMPLFWALAVFSGVLAPAFLLAIWWDRMTGLASASGMLVSLAAIAAIAAGATIGTDLSPASGDEFLVNIPGLEDLPLPVIAAIVALAFGSLVAAIAAFLPGKRLGGAELDLLRVPDARQSGEDGGPA
jgi:hypothetical protein